MMPERERRLQIVGWEITSQCNLTCPHCFSAASKRPRDEMTTDECKKTIDSMADIGVRMIGWTGGEPLLREDLEELIEYAGRKGIKSNVTTNGVLLDRRRATHLVEAGNRAIQISLDGSTPEKNQRMRRASEEDFYRIIEGIRICGSLNARVYLAMLLGQENLDDGLEMIKLAKREGVESIRFCGYTPAGRGKRGDVQTRLCFTDKLQDLLRFAERAQADDSVMTEFDTGFGPVPPEYSFHKCRAGVETFYLKGNGDMYPCTALLHKQFRMGNLRERPLREIWDSRDMRIVPSQSQDEIHGPCQTCDNFPNCHGACRGAAFAHTGNLRASFPTCLYRVAVEASVRS